MQRRLPLSVVCVVLAGCAHAPMTDTDGVASSLTALERDSWRAWKDQDAAFFARVLSADHVDVLPAGVFGRDAVVASIRGRACSVASYALTDFKVVRWSADMAVVTYRASQDTRCGSAKVPSPAWVSSVYHRRGATWENVLFQQTQATP